MMSAITTHRPPASRHRIHTVIAPHDGQVEPQRNLHVGVAQPSTDDVQRHLPDHQPVPSRRVPQAVSSCTALTSTWRLLVEARPLDAVADVPPTPSSWPAPPPCPSAPCLPASSQRAAPSQRASVPCEPDGSSTSGRATSPDDPSSRGPAIRAPEPRPPADRCAT